MVCEILKIVTTLQLTTLNYHIMLHVLKNYEKLKLTKARDKRSDNISIVCNSIVASTIITII